MNKKNLLSAILMATSMMCSQLNAQEVKHFEPTNNVIKVNYGPGLVYSEIIDYDKLKTHKASMSLDLSVDYAHTFNKGIGFGINVVQSHLNAIGCNDFYAGASVYYAYQTDNRWYFDASLGAGYAGNDYSQHESGVGLFEEVGAHYKLTRHFGIGAELRSLSCFYQKPDDWDRYYAKDGVFGTQRITLSLGLQYYF